MYLRLIILSVDQMELRFIPAIIMAIMDIAGFGERKSLNTH